MQVFTIFIYSIWRKYVNWKLLSSVILTTDHCCSAFLPFCHGWKSHSCQVGKNSRECAQRENLHYTRKWGEGPQALCWERQVEVPAIPILEGLLPLKVWRTWGWRGSTVVRALGRPWNGDLHQFNCSWVSMQDHLTCSPAVALTHCWHILDSCHLWIGSSAWREAAGMLGGHGFLWVPILVVPLTLQKSHYFKNRQIQFKCGKLIKKQNKKTLGNSLLLGLLYL